MKLIIGLSLRAIAFVNSPKFSLEAIASTFLISLGLCYFIASKINYALPIYFLGTSITPKNFPSNETLILMFWLLYANNSCRSSQFWL
jgi:hypothetical protein